MYNTYSEAEAEAHLKTAEALYSREKKEPARTLCQLYIGQCLDPILPTSDHYYYCIKTTSVVWITGFLMAV